MKIRGIIFDLDGTILNSFDFRILAWNGSFRKFGITPKEDELKPLIGLPGLTLAAKYSSDPYAVEMEEERIFAEHLPEISLFPDVPGTFMELKRRNIGTVIVTSSRRKMVDMITLPTNLVVTIDDVKHGKPDTEPYLKAMQLLGITEPGAIMVVGDALTDMIPARKLGNLAVLIKHGRKFDTDIPNYEIDEVSEILDLLDQP
ncbi:MAG: HAD family hydrolase [Candidatus Thermoplasmatota archaeon]|nr:HAD family hydrolase [Candidatus Thermoplasmatota archaeon]